MHLHKSSILIGDAPAQIQRVRTRLLESEQLLKHAFTA
jgi:hypothetical protein